MTSNHQHLSITPTDIIFQAEQTLLISYPASTYFPNLLPYSSHPVRPVISPTSKITILPSYTSQPTPSPITTPNSPNHHYLLNRTRSPIQVALSYPHTSGGPNRPSTGVNTHQWILTSVITSPTISLWTPGRTISHNVDRYPPTVSRPAGELPARAPIALLRN